jgi:hypothetical protein
LLIRLIYGYMLGHLRNHPTLRVWLGLLV